MKGGENIRIFSIFLLTLMKGGEASGPLRFPPRSYERRENLLGTSLSFDAPGMKLPMFIRRETPLFLPSSNEEGWTRSGRGGVLVVSFFT